MTRGTLAALVIASLVVVLASAAPLAPPPVSSPRPAKVSESLWARISAPTDIIVRMKTSPSVASDPTVQTLQVSHPTARSAKRQRVFDLRTRIAQLSQRDVLSYLSANHAVPEGIRPRNRANPVESLWLTNSVYVRGASQSLVEALAQREDVELIVEDGVIATLSAQTAEAPAAMDARNVEWNIAIVEADVAWNITRGEGVVVGNVDTGVRYTHEALQGNYRGGSGPQAEHDYNWWDPLEYANDDWWCGWGCDADPWCCADYPFDNIGHGSHCMGTTAGALGIGVAPGASWIAGKGCRDGACLNYGLTTSSQFLLCPTDRKGENPRCDLGADIAANSWGGGSGDPFIMDIIDAQYEAGMIVVFANGNSGPRCGTANSPGDFANVLGIGASDSADALASFSSRGPGPDREGFAIQKPDVTAPGAAIRSAGGRSDDQYDVSSGTSMATPLVAGQVALMLSVNPDLSFEQVRDILYSTSEVDLAPPDHGRTGTDECDGVHWTQVPNFHYGHGRVNVLKSVHAALAARD